jgi:hypothetical protein
LAGSYVLMMIQYMLTPPHTALSDITTGASIMNDSHRSHGIHSTVTRITVSGTSPSPTINFSFTEHDSPLTVYGFHKGLQFCSG